MFSSVTFSLPRHAQLSTVWEGGFKEARENTPGRGQQVQDLPECRNRIPMTVLISGKLPRNSRSEKPSQEEMNFQVVRRDIRYTSERFPIMRAVKHCV